MIAAPHMRIDLNADVGESFGAWIMGQDEALLPSLTSANVACGLHAGDPDVMRRTVRLARANRIVIGAHPGYPDLSGFGRRELGLTHAEIETTVLYQIGALAAIAAAEGVTLGHVKAHGALYNRSARDPEAARAIARAVAAIDRRLVLVGLAASCLLDAGREAGLRVAAEAFADRGYEPDGRLRHRGHPDALVTDLEAVLGRVRRLVLESTIEAIDGTPIRVHADTVCVHGDTPGAPGIARRLREGLEASGISVAPLVSEGPGR
jgi:UPF0271 protein